MKSRSIKTVAAVLILTTLFAAGCGNGGSLSPSELKNMLYFR